ncbi:MAG: CBS domain-containing protein [Gammaproteobacteria bacterium]|nr:MAG: CBS domain-containing protein [Gammaproteobacteria bacterium]
MHQQLVRDWMSGDVITASKDTTLPDAHKMMVDNKIRRLPVMRRGKLVGIITRGDVRGAEPSQATSLSVHELHYLLARLTIDEIMTPKPFTVRPDDSIGYAAKIMMDNNISGLPVVENGELVGIITESDIFRMIVSGWHAD